MGIDQRMIKLEDRKSCKFLQKKLAESFPRSMKEHYTDIDLRANIVKGSPPPPKKNIPPILFHVCSSTMETHLGEAEEN